MTRLLLGLLIGYLGFIIIRKVARSLGLWPQAPQPVERKDSEPDVLVQDPVCGTFIPRKEALKAERDGKAYFFCSEGCLKRFRHGGGA
jgi:YHS domain-containing protein